MLNRNAPEKKAVLEKSTGGWKWQKTADVDYRYEGNRMEVRIPRKLFGKGPLRFQFKWSDNMQETGNIMDFLVNGDVAPAGRFNYAYAE